MLLIVLRTRPNVKARTRAGLRSAWTQFMQQPGGIVRAAAGVARRVV